MEYNLIDDILIVIEKYENGSNEYIIDEYVEYILCKYKIEIDDLLVVMGEILNTRQGWY
jgi:hypothetical protein